ncbi:MAG: hypothetical protein SPK06_04315 [Kiritimatiellia bacterium]|nr:hypothetical protein [Kiritimatiellia bacterium]
MSKPPSCAAARTDSVNGTRRLKPFACPHEGIAARLEPMRRRSQEVPT